MFHPSDMFVAACARRFMRILGSNAVAAIWGLLFGYWDPL